MEPEGVSGRMEGCVMNRFKQFLHRHMVIQAVHAIAWVLAVFAIGLGASLIIALPEIVHLPTFSATFDFAPKHVWGIGFAGLGTWLAAGLAFNPAAAPLPLSILGVLTAVWGMFTLPAVANSSGAITAIWAYSAISAITLITAASITQQAEAKP